MREWKVRDTVLVVFLTAIVGIMLMQMVQSDRLYDRFTDLIHTMERQGSRTHYAGGGPAGAGDGSGPELLVPDTEIGGSVTVCYSAQPPNLNPLTHTDTYASIILEQAGVYTQLITRDPDTLEFVGQIAEDWSVSDDKLKLTFHLKEYARWSDGHPITAHDVAFSFQAMMIPTVDAQRIQTYFTDVDSVVAEDDHTVAFTMKKPYFKSLEMTGGLMIIPQHQVDPGGLVNSDPEELAKRINGWNYLWDGKPPVSSGPYILDSWDKTAQRVELRRNLNYWGPLPPLDRLVFKFIQEDVARLQALKSEEIDVLWLTPEQWENETNDKVFKERIEKVKYQNITAGYNYIGYNQQTKPFDEKKVRHALSYCMPREQIREKILYNLSELVNGPFALGGPQSNPEIGQWPYDPAKAKELLHEAGFRDTDGDGILDRNGKALAFSLSIPSSSAAYAQICALFQDELSKIGVKLTIDPYEWSVFVERLMTRDFQACMLGWGGTIESDPYQIWHSSSMENRGSNHVGFSNAEVDRLIVEARAEFDEEKRNAMYHRIHEIIFEEQPYTFLFRGMGLLSHHRRIKNVDIHKTGVEFMDWWVPADQRRMGE